MLNLKWYLLISTASLLAGCGGGSSSAGTGSAVAVTAPVTPNPVTAQSYTVAGNVSGLAANSSLSIMNNGADPTTIRSNGNYQFAVQITSNGSYAITIAGQPASQSCSIANASGTNITHNISNADISCSQNPVLPVPVATPVVPIAATAMSSVYQTIVWQDNFTQDTSVTPNAALWAMLTGNGTEYGNTGWGNNEAEYYLPANASVSNGALRLHGVADAAVAGYGCGNDQSSCRFSSVRMTSLKSIDLSQPGFLEIQAEIPTAMGSWPAIWLLPGQSPGQSFPPSANQLAAQPSWPSGGEIDLVEYMWLYLAPSTTLMQTSIHLPSGANSPFADSYQYVRSNLSAPAGTTFHLYQLAWTATQINYAIDNSIIMSCLKATQTCTPRDPTSPGVPAVSNWPYGTSFTQYYLLMNLAIGGNAGITGSNNSLVPANYDQTMVVNYVRYLKP